MKPLQALADAKILAPIDVELGNLLARRASGTLGDLADVQVVAIAGALLSAERASGHSCVSLRDLSEWRRGDNVVGIAMPDAAGCRAILERSGLCGDGSAPSPLVLDGDRLYLYRFHLAEHRLAAAIRARLEADVTAAPLTDDTAGLFAKCFGAAAEEPVNWQAVAAAAALRNNLTVITGGPGTGKTYTVARVLALLLTQDASRRVAIAAPTGKAAARLAESLNEAAEELELRDDVRAALPREGRTLHRLLGYQPWKDEFRHGADAPLAEDVVVVDEASMVDLLMMDALFAAVRPDAKIILLGDQDQLASVDTGFVLGDICRAADGCGTHHSPAFAAWYAGLTGQRVEAANVAAPIRDAVVRLHRSRRFEDRPGIGAFAEAVRRGDVDGALDVLAEGSEEVAHRVAFTGIGVLMDPLIPAIDAYLDAATPDADLDAATSEVALQRLGAFRILCAVREGPRGVAGINDEIERWLRSRGKITRAQWYRGRPVLVTANDPATGLYNGDVGVVRIQDGRAVVHFMAGGSLRAIPTSRMPAHATAWAMTVHKAQGSEFDSVHLVLPDVDNRVLARELIYTGVTRARTSVTIHGPASVLRAAIGRVTTRASGLEASLRSSSRRGPGESGATRS
ncbi:MAG: exodeoxyribonuclease V subunit alpha [Gemmatimonadaceae bacterium]|nr:exodeoxyribonuclease V subunit alpha [Gemmatimonadaceae bacterium]